MRRKKYKSLSLIIPFFNSGAGILQTYKKVTKCLKENFLSYRLIFVDDGSVDNSLDLLKKETKWDKKVHLITYRLNHGRGYAIKMGFTKATGEMIGYIDSDLEISPKYIISCFQNMETNDAVIVSKHIYQSHVDAPLKRRIASWLFNFWIKLILGSKVNDHQAGLKIFRRKKVAGLLGKIKSDRWLFDVELLYLMQKKGMKIVEVPIKISYGYEKIDKSFFVDFIKMFFWVLRMRLLDNTILKK